MPVYEFKCNVCGFKFEEILSIKDSNPKCSKCNNQTEKLISKFFGIVKGSENRTLDCIIGEDADKKWQAVEKRRSLRHKKQSKAEKA